MRRLDSTPTLSLPRPPRRLDGPTPPVWCSHCAAEPGYPCLGMEGWHIHNSRWLRAMVRGLDPYVAAAS